MGWQQMQLNGVGKHPICKVVEYLKNKKENTNLTTLNYADKCAHVYRPDYSASAELSGTDWRRLTRPETLQSVHNFMEFICNKNSITKAHEKPQFRKKIWHSMILKTFVFPRFSVDAQGHVIIFNR